jgi:hypothetical protein
MERITVVSEFSKPNGSVCEFTNSDGAKAKVLVFKSNMYVFAFAMSLIFTFTVT